MKKTEYQCDICKSIVPEDETHGYEIVVGGLEEIVSEVADHHICFTCIQDFASMVKEFHGN